MVLSAVGEQVSMVLSAVGEQGLYSSTVRELQR
jgi:hypothetical protein